MTRRILLADDHAFVSWSLAKALAAIEDVEIVGSVVNGIEAIAQIRKTNPHCAILDYNMPGANGLEVFLEARRWSPETRFILLTGSTTPAVLDSLIKSGIHGVSLKDTGEADLVDMVGRVLAGEIVVGASAARLLRGAANAIALTDRELAVLQAIARGHTNASAAESLGISPKTIDTHRTSLMRKFAVSSTASLLVAAVRAGLVDPSSIR